MPSTKSVNSEPGVVSGSVVLPILSQSRTLWVTGVVFSMIALSSVPFYKYVLHNHFTGNWFFDIFGETGIIMVSASMAIAAGFEVIARKRELNKLGIFLVLLAFFCYLEYGLVMVDSVTKNEDEPKTWIFVAINTLGFFAMVIAGLLSFSLPSSGSGKSSDNSRKRKQK